MTFSKAIKEISPLEINHSTSKITFFIFFALTFIWSGLTQLQTVKIIITSSFVQNFSVLLLTQAPNLYRLGVVGLT